MGTETSAMSGRLVVVGGGVRSGKSACAVRLALRRGTRRAFVATAQAFDDEMRERITRHQRERGDAFDTVEAPSNLAAALDGLAGYDVVVVDCITVWLSNLMLADVPAEVALERLDRILSMERAYQLVVVTNEVGMGIVPATPLGRAFRDLAGWANQRLSHRADELYLAALGTILRLRPNPVVTISAGDDYDSTI